MDHCRTGKGQQPFLPSLQRYRRLIDTSLQYHHISRKAGLPLPLKYIITCGSVSSPRWLMVPGYVVDEHVQTLSLLPIDHSWSGP